MFPNEQKKAFYGFIVSPSAPAYQIVSFGPNYRDVYTNPGCCGYVFYVIYFGVWARTLVEI